jgi:hypothetical protein
MRRPDASGGRRAPIPTAALLALAGLGCATLGRVITELATERPPLPLERADISSDARLDSTGVIAGSFVGEGTLRQVHLLSSDPTLIADLVRRYRPDRDRRMDPLDWLERRGTWAINLDPKTDAGLRRQPVLIGSPAGHNAVRLRTILLHGPRCAAGRPQAELVVEPDRSGGPELHGPVVGSFRPPQVRWPVRDEEFRDEPQPADPALEDTLLDATRAVMDSLLDDRIDRRDAPLDPGTRHRLTINTLDDWNAADIAAFRLDDGRIRYAVSLREARRTARGRDALAAVAMVWDASLAWRQVVFRPTLLEVDRHGPGRALGGRTAPVYWRRLSAVSGFAFGRDYLWMEQVDVQADQVEWVILEPRGNTVVAAALVSDRCDR